MDTEQTINKYGAENCLVIMDSHKKISDYYYTALGIRFDHFHYDDLASRNEFIDLVKGSEKDFLSLAVDSRTDLSLPGIAMQYFPHLILKKDYFGGNYYLFSRQKEGMDRFVIYSGGNGLSGEEPGWSPLADTLILDSVGISGSQAYHISGRQEFSPTFNMPLHELVKKKNDMIDISVAIRSKDSLNQSMLVLQVKNKRGLVEWTASPFQDYDPGDGNWYRVHHTFRTTQNLRRKNLEVNVYIWNKDKINFLSDEFFVRSRKGNPVLYGLMEKF
jgi:hypothetical protein